MEGFVTASLPGGDGLHPLLKYINRQKSRWGAAQKSIMNYELIQLLQIQKSLSTSQPPSTNEALLERLQRTPTSSLPVKRSVTSWTT
jgi:magnesium transporter